MAKYIIIKKWEYGTTTMHTVHDDRLCFEDINTPAVLETSSRGVARSTAQKVAGHLNSIESVRPREDGTKVSYEVATIEI
tara:strand:- start:284 stop:523 length:240 start_codon:yes stop_codon:yes gene_type:complete